MKKIMYNVFLNKNLLLTKNLTPKQSFFKDDIFNETFRLWDPKRSKFASAILKKVELPLKRDSNVLYLGASHGYTCSFLSDILTKGCIFCLDFAPHVVRDLVYLCEKRKNMSPLLEDANHPENYKNKISKVNLIFQDIAQRNQVQIFLKNIKTFLNKDDYAILVVKARSIDVTKNPKIIFNDIEIELRKHLKLIDRASLFPYERDHFIFVCQVK